MSKTDMRNFKVRWDGIDEREGQRVTSVVSYSEEGALSRAELLRAAGRTGVEVFEVKPGTDEEITR
jgi:hypothetical protein